MAPIVAPLAFGENGPGLRVWGAGIWPGPCSVGDESVPNGTRPTGRCLPDVGAVGSSLRGTGPPVERRAAAISTSATIFWR
jgi:hypothetical protein